MALWTVSGATTIVDACLERVAWVQAPVLAPLISMSSAQRPPPCAGGTARDTCRIRIVRP